MENLTGFSQSQAAMKITKEWQIEENIIWNFFDTTASNTGVDKVLQPLMDLN